MAKKNFETSLSKLEKITEELENGDLTLETSLKKFEEGVNLADFCHQQLTEAKAKIEILLEKNDQLKSIQYDEEYSGDH